MVEFVIVLILLLTMAFLYIYYCVEKYVVVKNGDVIIVKQLQKIGEKMKNIFNKLLPALLCSAAVGCSTSVINGSKTSELSAEQLEFQKMVKEQEALAMPAFSEQQVNKASISMNNAIDRINKINADLEAFIAAKEAKKEEIKTTTNEKIANEIQKVEKSPLQDEYWSYVDQRKELEASKPVSKSIFNPMTWFSSDKADNEESVAVEGEEAVEDNGTEVTEVKEVVAEPSEEDKKFVEEEYEIALKINDDNIKKTEKAYKTLKAMTTAVINQLKADCDKEIKAIDADIAKAKKEAEAKIAAANKVIEDCEATIERYKVDEPEEAVEESEGVAETAEAGDATETDTATTEETAEAAEAAPAE